MRCYVNLDGFRKTKSGKRKVWQTDGVVTYCCSANPSLFVWEKNTRYNDYNGYHGYVNQSQVEE
jgi:hypothetical protein